MSLILPENACTREFHDYAAPTLPVDAALSCWLNAVVHLPDLVDFTILAPDFSILTHPIWIEGSLGEKKFWLGFCREKLFSFLLSLLPDLPDLPPAPSLPFLLEWSGSPILAHIEATSGQAVSLNTVTEILPPSARSLPKANISCLTQHSLSDICIVLEPESALSLDGLLPVSSKKIMPPGIIQVLLGAQDIALDVWQTLKIGDGLRIRRYQTSSVIACCGRLTARGLLSQSAVTPQFVLESSFSKIITENIKKETTVTETPLPENQETFDDKALGTIPLKLTFELAHVTTELHFIQSAKPGDLISLPPNATKQVSVLANGRKIGEGALVQAGDALAVRLTRIA